ncbi:hypothetical protein BH11MYX1_BH11MYX1_14110 [soil metagenome]
MRLRLACALLLVSTVASAESRAFTHAYEYPTLPEGETELALWHQQSRDVWDKASAQRFEQQLQLGLGVTERLEAALFTVFTQATNEAFAFASLRGLVRYRLFDRGSPVDAVIHVEGAKDFGLGIYNLSGELDLARDLDRITVVANAIGALAMGHDVAAAKLHFEWAAGATYEVVAKLHAGVETWGSRAGGITRAEFGPAIGVQASARVWLALTAGFGLDADSDAFSGRLIVGLYR